MSGDLPPDDEQLPLAARERADQVCLAFEDAWRAGGRPRIEHYLADTPEPEHPALLRELLLLESYYRRQSGETLSLDEYYVRFPNHRQVVAGVLESMGICPACSRQVLTSNCQCPYCGQAVGALQATPARLWAEGTTSIQRDPGRSLSPWGQGSPSLSAEHGQFLPGVVIANRYRIVGLLGRGGMGEVYRADDLKLGQALALKFLPDKLAGDSDALALLRNEVRLARQIAHPNVCRVYDIGEAARQQFLSMEYVDGEDLAGLLRRIGRLPPDRGLAVARQLVAGLAAAHNKGILHRDLKPANVMLDGRGQVRITDFGLACLSEAAADEPFRAGTPLYMAPEQLAGKPISVRGDLYSLGLVLYEVFTGQQAFQGDSATELARVHRQASLVPPSAIVAGFDPVVERVILRCLEEDPENRPPSAPAILAALPGAGPLEAALAAGETPSPEMVAAAGQSGGLHPAVGVLCLIGILVGLLAVAVFSDRTTLVGQTDLKASDVLSDTASQIIQRHGYQEPPADRAHGFAYERDQPRITQIFFWYRQSPSVLVPQMFAGSFVARGDGGVSPDDPPPIPGEATVWLDPQGRLLEFRAIPSADGDTQSVPGDSGSPGPDGDFPAWCTTFFRQAGFLGEENREVVPESFSPLPSTRILSVGCDSRKVWKGVDPKTGVPVRVEAAAWRGKPVYFRVVPDRPADRRQRRLRLSATFFEYVKITLFVLLMAGAGLLARHNLRCGRGDRRGGFRLACYVFAVYALSWLLLTGRAARPPPWSVFIMGMEMAVFLSLVLWLFYIALEPYVRRIWPDTLVSWNRLLAGRFRDPLVGRDLLVGVLFGVGTRLLWQIAVLAPAWCGLGPVGLLGPHRGYFGVSLRMLLGERYCLGELLHYQATSIAHGLTLLLLLLLLRFVLRKQVLAAAAYVLGGGLVLSMAVGHPYISGLIGALASALLVVLLMRFGLVAVIGYTYVRLLLTYPITADLSAWHAGSATLLPLGVIVALAGYSFYISLAGRPLIRDAIV
ncbi:MAG: protein kinase [Planctomycetota bacterium]